MKEARRQPETVQKKPQRRSKFDTLIAELSNALIGFQEAEDISNLFMIAVLEECVQIWKRKKILKKLNKEEN